MDTLQHRLRRLDQLPAVPHALTRVLTLLGEAEIDNAEVEKAVQMDRALSLSTLRLANSPLFAGSSQLSSVGEAVRRLGTRNLMKVVLTHFASQALDGSGAGYDLQGEESWAGALAGGIAAEVIADTLGVRCGVDPATAFTAGLLRDCGKLAMDQLVGIESLRDAIIEERDGDLQVQFERDRFGFDHAEVGAELASLWGLGVELIESIRHHHDPPADGSSPLADVVCVADMICCHLGYGIGLDGMHYVLRAEVLERLGIDWTSFSMMMSTTLERLVEFDADTEDSTEAPQ